MLVSDVIQCDQCARYSKSAEPGWLSVESPGCIRRDFCSESCAGFYYSKRGAARNPHDPPAPAEPEPGPEPAVEPQPDAPAPLPVMLHTRAFYVRAGWDGVTGADDLQRDFDAWRSGPNVDSGEAPVPLNGWGLIARTLPPDEARIRKTLGWALDLPMLSADEPVTVLIGGAE